MQAERYRADKPIQETETSTPLTLGGACTHDNGSLASWAHCEVQNSESWDLVDQVERGLGKCSAARTNGAASPSLDWGFYPLFLNPPAFKLHHKNLNRGSWVALSRTVEAISLFAAPLATGRGPPSAREWVLASSDRRRTAGPPRAGSSFGVRSPGQRRASSVNAGA